MNHEHLSENDYLRQRISPRCGDENYLHLSDLLQGLQKHLPPQAGKILDFGCGGSPYKPFFPGSCYARADIEGSDLDFQISGNGTIDCADQSFDIILSTQVLEHVPNHQTYLGEAFRLLKPGGTLLISTHGSFYDHGCPYDFRRWTADGLEKDLKAAGFAMLAMEKLTTGPRAVLYLGEQHLGSLWSSRKTALGWGLWMFQKCFWSRRALRHKWIDATFPGHRVVPASDRCHSLYICLLATAIRPD